MTRPDVLIVGGGVIGCAVAYEPAKDGLWVSGLTELLGYIGFTLGLSAAATVGGLIALRSREGPQRVPTPGYPWRPGLFILLTVAAAGFMAARQPFQAAMGVLTLATDVLIYWLMRVAHHRKFLARRWSRLRRETTWTA
jgi:glycine/D-amino acid oxidase-like deaminating enzyme